MEYKQFDFFSMIVEALTSKPGCHFFILKNVEDVADICDVFTFKSKDEFDLNFETKAHPYYNIDFYVPKNIKKQWGNYMYDCVINDETYYLNLQQSYLIVNGKLITS